MTMNVYRALLELLPEDPLRAGDVSAVHADGTVTVDLPGGGSVRVRGVADLGARVFVRAGVVEGEAPALPVVFIEE